MLSEIIGRVCACITSYGENDQGWRRRIIPRCLWVWDGWEHLNLQQAPTSAGFQSGPWNQRRRKWRGKRVSLGHDYSFDFTGFGDRARQGLCLFLCHTPFLSLNTNNSQLFNKGKKRCLLLGGRRLLVTGMCSLTVSLRTVARQRRPGGSMWSYSSSDPWNSERNRAKMEGKKA